MVAILGQLILLAYQARTTQDVRLIRIWAVSAVTPLARVLEEIRGGTVKLFDDYLILAGAQSENLKMKEELGRLKMENQYLRAELSTADRAQALQAFQKQAPSKTLAARVIGTSTGANSKVVFVDRGSTSGVLRGMAVVTPDGIVGKVVASYPTASQVQLITDPTFAAGVVSQKNRVYGTLKGQGRSDCIVDFVQAEQKVEVGERFFTSGDDRIFPKGFPVGDVSVVRNGSTFKEIFVIPSGFRHGLEEVLIVVEGVHLQIPMEQAAETDTVSLMPPPPTATPAVAALPAGSPPAPVRPPAGPATDGDRLKNQYRDLGAAVGYKFGEGRVSPDFNKKPAPVPAAPIKPPGPAAGTTASPPVAVPAPPTKAPPAP